MKIELTERDLKHIDEIQAQYRRLGWEYAYDEPPSATIRATFPLDSGPEGLEPLAQQRHVRVTLTAR